MYYPRCHKFTVAILFFSLLLQSCGSNLNAIVEASKPKMTHKSGDPEQGSSQAYSLASGAPLVSLSPAVFPAAVRGVVIASSHCSLSASSTQSKSLSPTKDAVGMPDAQPSSRLFTASTGELVRFQQVGSQWQAVVQEGVGTVMYKRTLPVVSAGDIGTQLAGLQRQDVWASRSRIHIMATSHSPHASCVYLGKSGLLGGMPTQQTPLVATVRSNEAGEALGSRDQEIAPTSNALAADLRTRTFGTAEWKQYFGDVGSAPDLPSDMAAILDGPCPFWPNRKVRDTHLLVLIPATVDGVPFTLNRLGELIKNSSNGGHTTKYSYYSDLVKAQIGEQSPPRSYWLLMTYDVLSGSPGKVYSHQKELVAGYAGWGSAPYELPSVLEAATAILTHHAREGERLFGDDSWACTRCQEMVDSSYPAVVGGFESSGLNVFYCNCDYDGSGVACCRKF